MRGYQMRPGKHQVDTQLPVADLYHKFFAMLTCIKIAIRMLFIHSKTFFGKLCYSCPGQCFVQRVFVYQLGKRLSSGGKQA